VGLALRPGLPEDIRTPSRGLQRRKLDRLALGGLGLAGPLPLPPCLGGVGSPTASTTASTALHAVTDAGTLPAGGVRLSQPLARDDDPRGLRPRPPWPSVALLPRRCRQPPASEALARPGGRRRSPRASATPPVRADGAAVRCLPACCQPSRADETVGSHRCVGRGCWAFTGVTARGCASFVPGLGACGSLRKRDLLLDLRTDNGGQGTCTP
jgi:hypothetical protein